MEEMTNEERQKDARRLSEILYQFCALMGYSFGDAVSIITYAIIEFVVVITTQNKGNESEEIERFANYVNMIAASYKRAAEDKKKGS
jgi:hypothetical protein